jgi:hypothetical protein
MESRTFSDRLWQISRDLTANFLEASITPSVIAFAEGSLTRAIHWTHALPATLEEEEISGVRCVSSTHWQNEAIQKGARLKRKRQISAVSSSIEKLWHYPDCIKCH